MRMELFDVMNDLDIANDTTDRAVRKQERLPNSSFEKIQRKSIRITL